MRLKDTGSFLLKLNELRKRPIVKRGGMPDFHILGAQKSGTSSLFRYLFSHPQVYAPYKKELQYYSKNYDKGLDWYKTFFPADSDKKRKLRLVSGEATPYYIFHPQAAAWIHADTPDAKLIVLLRDPVSRAYSHYIHNVRPDHNNDTLSFEEALQMEETRLKDSKLLNNKEFYFSRDHQRYSYKVRGRYLEQIKRYHELFPKEQLLIIAAEDFFKDRQKVMDQVCDHLEIDSHIFKSQWKFNTGTYKKPMQDETKQYLIEYFRPLNEELYDYLGRNFGWMK
jgi:Sulfotransferase domain